VDVVPVEVVPVVPVDVVPVDVVPVEVVPVEVVPVEVVPVEVVPVEVVPVEVVPVDVVPVEVEPVEVVPVVGQGGSGLSGVVQVDRSRNMNSRISSLMSNGPVCRHASLGNNEPNELVTLETWKSEYATRPHCVAIGLPTGVLNVYSCVPKSPECDAL